MKKSIAEISVWFVGDLCKKPVGVEHFYLPHPKSHVVCAKLIDSDLFAELDLLQPAEGWKVFPN